MRYIIMIIYKKGFSRTLNKEANFIILRNKIQKAYFEDAIKKTDPPSLI